MTETTKERIENARKRLDIAEKWELPTMDQNIFAIVELADEVKKLSDMNASLGSMINNKIVEIKGLKSQLAALKEKYRWRKQSEEPAPDNLEIEIYDGSANAIFVPEGPVYIYDSRYWRPLDLPEIGEPLVKKYQGGNEMKPLAQNINKYLQIPQIRLWFF